MKKIILIISIIIIAGFITWYIIHDSKLNKILSLIELNNTKCNIMYDIDTHQGFLGDGDYFALINCENDIDDELTSNWKKLPLSDELYQITHMKQCDDKACSNIYERYSIPNIDNGYYYFIDRHSESSNVYDDSNLNNRASWNFTLAILDKDTNSIYYYELDT